MMGLIKRKILQLMTPSGNSLGELFYLMHLETMVTAIGLSHSWLQLVICMPFSQSKTISRAESILIQIIKIEYYNKVSFSLIFLLNEKKKKKKEEITTSRSILLLTMIV